MHSTAASLDVNPDTAYETLHHDHASAASPALLALNMSSDSESEIKQPNGIPIKDDIETPLAPSTPQETGPPDSQITLPSTEVPPSPINDANESFRTDINDDRPGLTVIPSSLTPPPSTQVGPAQQNGHAKRLRDRLSHSQDSNFVSPPATILNNIRDRDTSADYLPPSAQEVRESSADELRVMLQTCIGEQQKLKMETAHHRLQYNLLNLQASEDSNRAEVELDMLRKEIDALRSAEHSRQAKRELSTFSEALQIKYLDLKDSYEEAIAEIDAQGNRLKNAKKIIQQKDEEVMGLVDERHQLVTRIRENREHMNKLRSPGGIFHGAVTPKQQNSPAQHRGTPRDNGNKLSTLLEVISQDNNSAPSTPIIGHRSTGRQHGGHKRGAQSMSSLPTTPMNRAYGHHGGLLPPANLVPQTEPRQGYQRQPYEPGTPTPKADRRKSRESTISADDNEELARQALRSFTSLPPQSSSQQHYQNDPDLYDSQASQAATEMLRREPKQSFDGFSASRDGTPGPAEKSARMQAKLFSNLRNDGDKRKFSGSHEEQQPEAGSPPKKSRVGSGSMEQQRLGLGIEYRQ